MRVPNSGASKKSDMRVTPGACLDKRGKHATWNPVEMQHSTLAAQQWCLEQIWEWTRKEMRGHVKVESPKPCVLEVFNRNFNK